MGIKRKTNIDIDSIMKNALASDMKPDDSLNQKIIRMWKESPDMNQTVKRKIPVAATVAFCILVMTVTVGATVKYLTSAEVANRNGSTEIAQAFQGKEAIEMDEVKEAGDYRFTLMGVTTGKSLMETGLSEIMPNMDSMYLTVAIERKDGTPMPSPSDDEYGKLNFFMSPLIQGLKPWEYNATSMNGGYRDYTENGVLYRIVECNSVKLFADKKIYFIINDSTFFDTNAYVYNEETGEISRNTGYEGINLLFEIPFDPSEANPSAATEYLKNLEDSWDSGGTETEGYSENENSTEGMGPGYEGAEQTISYLEQGNFEEALKGAVLVEGSKKTVQENEGCYEYQWDTMGIMYFYKEYFKDGKTFMASYSRFDESSNQPTVLIIAVVLDNGDGSVDIEIYNKKI